MTSLSCRWCGEPVHRAETGGPFPLLARAVHIATGLEECADSRHLAAPIDAPGATTTYDDTYEFSAADCYYIAGCRWPAGCTAERKCIGDEVR